ncbi:MAG: WG repeat-containing protein [Muribaculaceae bacterium]|nr:WG repeat-containing protein [Muribaculaceae bacterium]
MEENGKWSFVDRDGNIKFEDEFKKAPSCVVNGVFSVPEDDGYTLYKADSKPMPIKDCENLKAAGYLSDGLIPIVRDKSRITLIDDSGKAHFILEPIKGKEVVSCAGGYSDGMLKIAIEGGLIGFVDTKGEVVVKPEYEESSDFYDGRAVVKKNDTYYIINKQGEILLRLKKDWVPLGGISYGVVPIKDANDHILFVNEKGEVDRCPAKVKVINGYNDKYYIFSDGESTGVMSRKNNEVVVRAKYNQIVFGPGNSFICKDDNGTYIINSNGDTEKILDEFEGVYTLGEFGIFAKDKKTWLMLDGKGDLMKGCEFHDILPVLFFGFSIESDYFSLEGMVASVVDNLNEKGYGDIKLGVEPRRVLSNPEKYIYSSDAEIESLSGKGYNYTYTVTAGFSGYIANGSYDYYSYSIGNSYNWNDVTLTSIEIVINADTSLGEPAVKEFVSALEKKGFKRYASNYKGGDGGALLTAPESAVLILSKDRTSNLTIRLIYRPDRYMLNQIKEQINNYVGSFNEKTNEVENVDSYTLDTFGDEEVEYDTVAW